LRRKYSRGNNGRLLAEFLDLKSSFDLVNRKFLIESLLEIGQPSCFTVVCCEGYGKFSRLVTSHVGVKQACNLSPKLFSLFVIDLDSFMANNGAPCESLD